MTTARTLDRDVACLNCGYNLRGIDPAGTCPECGLRIAVALRQDHLRDAPVGWRRAVHRGAAMIAWGTLVSFPLIHLGPILAAAGLWRVTVRQPGRQEPRHDTLVRIFARGTFVPGAVGFCAIVNALLWIIWRYRFSSAFDWRAYDSLLIGFGGLMGIGVAAMAQHLRALAERLGDARLVSRCWRLFWVWIAGGLVLVTLGGASNLYQAFGRPWHQYALHFAAAAMLVMLLLAVWLWAETLRVARHFQRTMKAIG